MKIYVSGSPERVSELHKFIPAGHSVEEAPFTSVSEYDMVFDLNLDEHPENIDYYAGLEGTPVFGCSVKDSLASIVKRSNRDIRCILVGFNALPTFINRSKIEVSLFNESKRQAVETLIHALGWQPHFVQDRVGMVSLRIISMIINEAFYTLQEGTATAEDIDESMKLGTNYPFGPFDWCGRIGLANVYELLEALYQDTHDDRYKVCPLLKTRYLRTM